MKVIQCVKLSSYLDLELHEIDPPGEPAADEIKVQLVARGIQFSDLVRFEGNYQVQTAMPWIVGGEAAGNVVAIGDNVSDLKMGDLVLCPGGCAEEVLVPAKRATKIPAGVDPIVAASFRSNYNTALDGLQRAGLKQGETLLVHGAAGGVGLAAVDIGKLYGATVIATASTDEKLKVVGEMGADHTINYTDGFRDAVKSLTNGLGADVIYDPVGGDVFDESVRCIAPFGRILVLGFTSGRAALAKTNHLLVKDASVIGYTVGGLMKYRSAQARQNDLTIMGWLKSGRIRPYISHVLPMSEIVEAYQLIVDRKAIGKIMLTN
tara:strand:+ start:16390 stop:17352 length:963 start_codon:yes stop_codon:yes gene_type:complete